MIVNASKSVDNTNFFESFCKTFVVKYFCIYFPAGQKMPLDKSMFAKNTRNESEV